LVRQRVTSSKWQVKLSDPILQCPCRSKVNTVLTKEYTVLMKKNTVLTKVNTMVLTKKNTVLKKVNIVQRRKTQY
jgi:hypothetical protein